jgi:RNA-splicing ligase RtcB
VKMGLKKITDVEWELERTDDMRVPGKVFASAKLLEDIDEKVREQITNVACLPGIQKASLAMPDAHWGYGFPIGGVGAFDPEEDGIICMGGIGFDISCGVRSFRTDMTIDEIKPKLKELVNVLFDTVPAGLGSTGKLKLNMNEIDELLVEGARWVVGRGLGKEEDLKFVEDEGAVEGAKPENVSDRAKQRQFKQIGTLGSGNHYLEIQYVEEIYDEKAAECYGLKKDGVVLSLHCGSRALGHQIGCRHKLRAGKQAGHSPPGKKGIQEGPSRFSRQNALRHQPQHLQGRGAQHRWKEKDAVRPQKGCHAGIRSREEGSSKGVQRHRPAGFDRWNDGHVLVHFDRYRGKC